MPSDPRSVQNFGRNVSFLPKSAYQPKSEEDVLRILTEHRGSRVRVVGRLHSYSEAACCEDVMLDLRHLNSVQIEQRDNGVWAAATSGLIVLVIGLSFAAMPFHKPLNGSLFYLPPLLAIAGLGLTVWLQRGPEPFLLPLAATVFAIAILARSIDWKVPFPCGTHFLWHLLNGLVLYLSMRAWILHQTVRAVVTETRS